MKRHLITGGSGFIGTNLSNLLKSQHDILILDRIPSKIQDVDFTECDLLDSKKLSDVLEGFDIVIHLAAAVGVKLTEEEPLHILNLNIQGTQNILESCKKNHVKKIIFASSSEIYGEAIHIPIKETDTPMPITNYGVSKITGEEYVKAYSKAHSIKYSILRFFNAYGPGQSNSFVMSEFCMHCPCALPMLHMSMLWAQMGPIWIQMCPKYHYMPLTNDKDNI